jgi:hypothetical protein
MTSNGASGRVRGCERASSARLARKADAIVADPDDPLAREKLRKIVKRKLIEPRAKEKIPAENFLSVPAGIGRASMLQPH